MKQLEIAVAVAATQRGGQKVVYLQPVSISEAQPTGGTRSLLSLKQVRHLRRGIEVDPLFFGGEVPFTLLGMEVG